MNIALAIGSSSSKLGYSMPIRLPPKTSISSIMPQALIYVCAALWSIGRRRNFLSIILGSNRIGIGYSKVASNYLPTYNSKNPLNCFARKGYK